MYSGIDEKDRIEDAAYIYWSTEVNIYLTSLQEEEYYLQSPNNPETILLEKNYSKEFTQECQIIVSIIDKMPRDNFLANGKVKKTILNRLVREKTGWSNSKVEQVKASLIRQIYSL